MVVGFIGLACSLVEAVMVTLCAEARANIARMRASRKSFMAMGYWRLN